jgi:hypothetical protein
LALVVPQGMVVPQDQTQYLGTSRRLVAALAEA